MLEDGEAFLADLRANETEEEEEIVLRGDAHSQVGSSSLFFAR